MTSDIIRKKFLDFFHERGHIIVPSSSLIPTDPTVLLTTAGMQQFKPYFTGKADPVKDFGGKNTASIQKSFRTSDIDEVGDESHLTFFEMLGNFSFGGYWKEEAIRCAHEFITSPDWMNLKIDYVSVFAGENARGGRGEAGASPSVGDLPAGRQGYSKPSVLKERSDVFGGDKEIPADAESEKIWQSLGIKDVRRAGREDNFWGPTGNEGPCGPTTEIYVKNSQDKSIEIWNIVFNEYYCSPDKKLSQLAPRGIDTGMGLERLAMVAQGAPTIFETDLFSPLMEIIPKTMDEKIRRVLADHARGIVFLISDGVRPSNKEQGYVLRKLMRRIIARHAFGSSGPLAAGLSECLDSSKLFAKAVELYGDYYPNLDKNIVKYVFDDEVEKYGKVIARGIKEMSKTDTIDAPRAFYLFESLGLPYEAVKDLGGDRVKGLRREDFDKEFAKHQELSRTASAGMFRGGLADHSEKTIRLHTAHHLLLKALQTVLGSEVKQRGSNITGERLRMDFAYGMKMTDEQKKEVERIVNEKIAEDLPVIRSEMAREEAEKLGAEHEFGEKYPEQVSVYSIGPKSATAKNPQLEKAFSIEFCGGPHVVRTGEIGKLKIAKEEAVAAGVRRIRGTLG